MKTAMKRFLSVVVISCMGIGVLPSALAVNDDPPMYLDNVVLVENGIPRKITQSEFDELNANAIYAPTNDISSTETSIETNKNITPYGAADLFENVTEFSPKIYYAQSKPVSAYITTGPSGGSISVVDSVSFSRSYSISVTSAMSAAISASIGAAYSVNNSQSIGYTLNINPNTTARVRFAPMCKGYRGTYKRYDYAGQLISSQQITVYQPQKINNYADGVYYLENR